MGAESVSLPHFAQPTWSDFAWTVVLAIVVAVAVFAIVALARRSTRLVARRPFALTIAAPLAVGGLAIAFHLATDQPADTVLFSGQDAFGALLKDAPTLSVSTLVLLLVCKGLAWSVSLGNFRGGPTFPAVFLGVVSGLLAERLPGFSETPAVAVMLGAACVSMLRLPLASIILALILTAQAGLGVAPWSSSASPSRTSPPSDCRRATRTPSPRTRPSEAVLTRRAPPAP